MLERYFATILGPLAMLLFAAFLLYSFPLFIGVILLSSAAQVIAPAWAGWLLVSRLDYSVSLASFSGPLLHFVNVFAFGYLPLLVLGKLPSLEGVAPEELIHNSVALTNLLGMVMFYVLWLPVSLAVTALGAYLGVRMRRHAARKEEES
jgi:hypothetical protein